MPAPDFTRACSTRASICSVDSLKIPIDGSTTAVIAPNGKRQAAASSQPTRRCRSGVAIAPVSESISSLCPAVEDVLVDDRAERLHLLIARYFDNSYSREDADRASKLARIDEQRGLTDKEPDEWRRMDWRYYHADPTNPPPFLEREVSSAAGAEGLATPADCSRRISSVHWNPSRYPRSCLVGQRGRSHRGSTTR